VARVSKWIVELDDLTKGRCYVCTWKDSVTGVTEWLDGWLDEQHAYFFRVHRSGDQTSNI